MYLPEKDNNGGEYLPTPPVYDGTPSITDPRLPSYIK